MYTPIGEHIGSICIKLTDVSIAEMNLDQPELSIFSDSGWLHVSNSSVDSGFHVVGEPLHKIQLSEESVEVEVHDYLRDGGLTKHEWPWKILYDDEGPGDKWITGPN